MTACDWPLVFASCTESTCSHLDSLDPEIAAAVEESAIEWLWEATNRRFGNCPVTLLPCLNGCNNNYGRPWTPYRSAPGSLSWVNVGCAVCANTCACSMPSAVFLPTGGTVTEVRIDGVVLPADDWRVISRMLIRLDGGAWPTCQDLTATPPSWEVDFIPGAVVPSMGQIAAGQLACQIARRLCGQACELPANTTSVTRQGVTIFIEPGTGTGIWLIDQWVELANRTTPRVYSPDVPAVLIGSTGS